MTKTEKAVRYMISAWDYATDLSWRRKPDNVQEKFLEAEIELLNSPKVDSVIANTALRLGDAYAELWRNQSPDISEEVLVEMAIAYTRGYIACHKTRKE